MEESFKFIGLLLVLIFLVLIYKQYKKLIQIYKEIGAEMFFYFPPKALLKLGSQKIEISYLYGLVIRTKVSLNGYLSLEKKWLGKSFNTFFDDPSWAKIVLDSSKLILLIKPEAQLPHLSSVEILGNTLKIAFYHRKIDQAFKEEIKRAIELLPEVVKSFEGLPSSKIGIVKERLRNWLFYYLPLSIFLIFTAVGIYWRVLGYGDVLCRDDLFKLGFKLLIPIYLLHLLATYFILGRHFHLRKNLLILIILYFAGYYLIPFVVLEPFNARFDRSEAKRIETIVKGKYVLYGKMGGFFLKLSDLNCPFRVSERLYKKAKIGDKMVFYVKEGVFGLPWAYRFWIERVSTENFRENKTSNR